MDLDSDILSLIDGYVSSAIGATGTRRAIHKPRVEPQLAESFEGDTIPDLTPLLQMPDPPPPLPRARAPRSSRPPSHEDFDDVPTAVNQQRLIR